VTSTNVTVTIALPTNVPAGGEIETSNEGAQNQTGFVPLPPSNSYSWTLTPGQGAKTVSVTYAPPGTSGQVLSGTRSVFLDLGASILSLPALSCDDAAYLQDYAFANRTNNPATVIKIQQFLNKFMGTSLVVNGVYNSTTQAAVDAFQVQYHSEVLRPWLPFGLPSELTATNNTYKTTQRWINILSCPGLNLPVPKLP
jgi:hypothetical protein